MTNTGGLSQPVGFITARTTALSRDVSGQLWWSNVNPGRSGRCCGLVRGLLVVILWGMKARPLEQFLSSLFVAALCLLPFRGGGAEDSVFFLDVGGAWTYTGSG